MSRFSYTLKKLDVLSLIDEFPDARTRSSVSVRDASLLRLGTHEALLVDEPHDQQRRAQEE